MLSSKKGIINPVHDTGVFQWSMADIIGQKNGPVASAFGPDLAEKTCPPKKEISKTAKQQYQQ